MINRTLEKILDIKSADLSTIFGIGDSNLKLIRSEIPVDITARGEKIKIIGEKDYVNQARPSEKLEIKFLKLWTK